MVRKKYRTSLDSENTPLISSHVLKYEVQFEMNSRWSRQLTYIQRILMVHTRNILYLELAFL